MGKIFIFFFSILILFACHDYRRDFESISFGRGGGFSGMYNQYRIDNTGNVYSINYKNNEATFVKLLPAKQCKLLFRNVSESGIAKLRINSPYNMTSYILLISKTDTIHVIWGDPKVPPGHKTEELFKVLMEIAE